MPLTTRYLMKVFDKQVFGTCLADYYVPACRHTASEPQGHAYGNEPQFVLRGTGLFDTSRATSTDVRDFWWTGLRLLRQEAQARGMSERDLRRLLSRSFDDFHEAAECVWETLKNVAFPGMFVDARLTGRWTEATYTGKTTLTLQDLDWGYVQVADAPESERPAAVPAQADSQPPELPAPSTVQVDLPVSASRKPENEALAVLRREHRKRVARTRIRNAEFVEEVRELNARED